MLTPQIQIVIVLALAGVVLFALGYRIRFRREWHLIGGFDCGQLRDPEGFGRWVGTVGILLGSITLGAAALAFTRPDLNAAIGSAYTTVVLAATAALAVGSVRHIL